MLLCVCAAAQDAARQDYFAQVEALQRDGASIAQQFGRDALIERYRNLINANPHNANNIRLETQIALLYESDFTDQGVAPDMYAAHQVYQNIIAHYDPEHPYMATVRKLGADRAVDFDPALAQEMYEGILADYPDRDALTVQTQFAMGKLAEEEGDSVAAEQYFTNVLTYEPSGAEVSDAEAASIQAYQENAAAKMLTDAIEGAGTPQERLKALKKFLEKHKELELAQSELVQRFAQALERGGISGDPEFGNNASVEALLASLKKNKPADGAGAAERDRERAREQRARDAEQDRARMARGENTSAPALLESAPTGTANDASLATARPTRAGATGLTLTYYSAAAIAIIVAAVALSAFLRRGRAS